MHSKVFIAAVVFCATLSAAHGQETSGVDSSANVGTVIKGKAPVAKELLKIRFPKPKSFRLSNGVEVFVLEDHRAPVVRFNFQLRAGSIYETKPGVANLTAAMLTEGTTGRTDTQIAVEAEDLGASVGANTNLEMATLSAASLGESMDKLIDLTADVLMHPTFPPQRLDRVKFSQRSATSQRVTNPTAIIGELSSQVFYGGTKYARLAPSRQDVAAITTDDLKSFYQKFYIPDGAIIGVTGDVTVDRLKPKLEAAFGSWKRAGAENQLPVADFHPSERPHVFLVDRPGSAQSVLQFGSLSLNQTDPDYIAVVVANRILGGGSSGRLFQNIREKKGYTYGAYSTIAGTKYPAVWGANASVRTEVTDPAIGEFFKEFARLQTERVQEAELNAAKRSIIGGFALTLQTPESVLARTLDQVENKLPKNFWDTYAERIQRVTPADVQRVAKKYLDPSRIQLMVVGQGKTIQPFLSKYGSVEVVDPLKISSVSSR